MCKQILCFSVWDQVQGYDMSCMQPEEPVDYMWVDVMDPSTVISNSCLVKVRKSKNMFLF